MSYVNHILKYTLVVLVVKN